MAKATKGSTDSRTAAGELSNWDQTTATESHATEKPPAPSFVAAFAAATIRPAGPRTVESNARAAPPEIGTPDADAALDTAAADEALTPTTGTMLPRRRAVLITFVGLAAAVLVVGQLARTNRWAAVAKVLPATSALPRAEPLGGIGAPATAGIADITGATTWGEDDDGRAGARGRGDGRPEHCGRHGRHIHVRQRIRARARHCGHA